MYLNMFAGMNKNLYLHILQNTHFFFVVSPFVFSYANLESRVARGKAKEVRWIAGRLQGETKIAIDREHAALKARLPRPYLRLARYMHQHHWFLVVTCNVVCWQTTFEYCKTISSLCVSGRKVCRQTGNSLYMSHMVCSVCAALGQHVRMCALRCSEAVE